MTSKIITLDPSYSLADHGAKAPSLFLTQATAVERDEVDSLLVRGAGGAHLPAFA